MHTLLSQMQLHFACATHPLLRLGSEWAAARYQAADQGSPISALKNQAMACFGLVGLFLECLSIFKKQRIVAVSQPASCCGVHSSFPSALC